MEKSSFERGTIFNIQRFSLHDGPGIRTLIFMKGCPLRCLWCSNPEGLSPCPEVLSNVRRCIGCGICIEYCKPGAIYIEPDGRYQIDRDKCTNCLKCAEVCPSRSKTVAGEIKTVGEIIKLAGKENIFYKHSGGGVTVGGGEMLMQPQFSYEILRRCRERGLNTAIETSGFGSLYWLLQIADQCDTIHYDLKAVDAQLHKSLTGVGNHKILDHLARLSGHLNQRRDPKPELNIRLPLVKGYNTGDSDLTGIAQFIDTHIEYYTCVEVLPFHNFGERKYEELGLDYEFANCPNCSAGDLKREIHILQQAGLKVKVSKW